MGIRVEGFSPDFFNHLEGVYKGCIRGLQELRVSGPCWRSGRVCRRVGKGLLYKALQDVIRVV